jgi:dipeptidyl aminopeptidase/acylaminoacyl peptidase
LLSIFFLMLVLPAGARPLQDIQFNVTQGVTIRRWTYLSDGLRVRGELYLPAGDKKLPLVIFNHDGISGISKEHRLSSVRLARAGFVVFSPSYRGEDGSEGMVEIAKGEVRDVLNVVPLLKAHPRVNGQKMALVGASHGALISVLAASRNREFKAVVSAYGVMDIYRWYDYLKANGKLGQDPVTLRTYGQGPEKRPESFAVRNALDVVAKLQCPVLLLQGSLDDIVPEEQARLMEAAMKKSGKRVRMEIYPDALHGFLVYAPYIDDASAAEKRQTEAAWATMIDFLRKELKAH